MGGTPAPKSFPQPGAIGTSQGMMPLTAAQAPQAAPQMGALPANPAAVQPANTFAGQQRLPNNPYAQQARQKNMWAQRVQGSTQY